MLDGLKGLEGPLKGFEGDVGGRENGLDGSVIQLWEVFCS